MIIHGALQGDGLSMNAIFNAAYLVGFQSIRPF
jgi:hypothetical protein